MGMCSISKHVNYSQILASKRYTCVLEFAFHMFSVYVCARVCVYALTPKPHIQHLCTSCYHTYLSN